MRKNLARLCSVALLALTAACAQVPTDPEERAEYEAANDPMEPMNRAVLDFNLAVDKAVLRPVSVAYREVVPATARTGVHNAVNNLREPWVFVNDVLQGEHDRAAQAMVRFLINSTAGVLGLVDVVAENGGPRHHDEDFGQTLAVWGVGEGPYVMLPLLGPSNLRDASGLVVEHFADPVDVALNRNDLEWATWTRLGVGILDTRTQLLDPLDELERGSLDFYSAIRSVYRQRRASLIANKDVSLTDSYKNK